jgi:hypothetical protein
MIPQDLIDKLQLEKTDAHFGRAFINNCSAYKWGDLLLTDCNLEGDPLKEGYYLIFYTGEGKWASCIMAYEILMQHAEVAIKIIHRQIDKIKSP